MIRRMSDQNNTKNSKGPGDDYVTNVTQINSQSDLIRCRALPARLSSQSDPLFT